ALAVQAGVHHQADGPPQLVLQVTEVVVRVRVQAQVFAQRLCVQAPALGERSLAAEAAELRQTGQLLLQRELEVVAGDRLVQEQVLRVPGLARGQVVGIDVEDAGTRAILARRHVAAAGRRLGAERLDRKSTRLN